MALTLEPYWTVTVTLVVVLGCCSAINLPFIHRFEPVDYDLDELSQQHERHTRSTSGDYTTIDLQFTAMGRPFDLVLIPDTTLFHKHLTAHSSTGNMDTRYLQRSVFTGYDRNTPGSHVHANMISGVLAATIYTDNDIYYVEPAHRYTRDTSYHTIVYRHSDINKKALQGARCGVDDSSIVEYLEKTEDLLTTPEGHEKRQEGTTREKRQASRNRTLVRCDLSMTGDFRFFEAVTEGIVGGTPDSKERVATSLLVSYVQGASRIFQRTDFDGNSSTTDNIQFGIRNLSIETSSPGGEISSPFVGVERFLQLHSEGDFSTFCLSYRFTNRDFNSGVLGLAYVAKQGAAGGICQDRLNTGIVTILNYNQRVPTQVTVLTLAHEAGHNFGSEHDPGPDEADPNNCSPSGNHFIMYPFANTGSEGNNDEFSSCSRSMMDFFIATRGQNKCFRSADDLCQNGFLEEGEQCDCGIDYEDEDSDSDQKICNTDKCCYGNTCTLRNDSQIQAQCSPDQGRCCEADTCSFSDSSMQCSSETECAEASFCTGTSAVCPEPEAKMPLGEEDFILCNRNTSTCVGNVCNGSICAVLSTDTVTATSCQCTEEGQFCDVCCRMGEEADCVSTIVNTTLAERLPGGEGQQLPVGAPCNNFQGYCDILNNCFIVDNEGALDRLGELFSSSNIGAAVDWIRERWWAVLTAAVGLLIGVFVLILVIHLVLPRPEHVRMRAQRRQTIRRNRKEARGYNMNKGQEMRKR